MKHSKLIPIVFLMVLTIIFSASVAYSQDWYDIDWQYRKEITIDATQVDANLTDFPLLIDLTDTNLDSGARPDGYDILFTGDDGITKFDHEIESYSAGDLVAWVRVPGLSSSTNTVVYMYYGNSSAANQENPAGVWDANYVMVQHLDEDSGTHEDSTLYNNDGTAEMGTDQTAQGIINGADEFDGSDDYVDCGNSSSLDIVGSMTVEAWVLSNNSAGQNRILSKDKLGVIGKFILWRNNSEVLEFQVADSSGWYKATGQSISPAVWMHLVGVVDVGNQKVRLYRNGLEVAEVDGPSSLKSNTETVTIGASDDHTHNWEGFIDEVRISTVPRSAEWISASYDNVSNPGTFYIVGNEEMQGVNTPPSVSNPSPADGAPTVPVSLAEVSFTVIDSQNDSIDYTVTMSPDVIGGPQSGTAISSGTSIQIPITGGPLAYNTVYTWNVDVRDPDGSGNATYETYSFTTESPPLPEPAFVWWSISDPHLQTDLPGYRSLESAIRDSKDGGDQGGESFNWDIATVAGDWTGNQQCPGDSDGQDLIDQWTGAGADPNYFYGVIGNHDAGVSDNWWFEKWVDPMGQQTAYSLVDNSARPYPVQGEWDHYSFEVGNIIFLMLGDRNEGPPPFGRVCSGGYPAGHMSLETYNWWVQQVETHPDHIIVTISHQALFETTIYTGFDEGFQEGIHGGHSWADQKGSSMIYAIDNWTIDGLDETETYIGERNFGFLKYLEDHPGAIDMWIHGHTHRDVYPGITFNGRSDVGTKHGVTFINTGALTKAHAGPAAPFSRLLNFYDNNNTVTVQTYMHSDEWGSVPEGFYEPAEFSIVLSQAFDPNYQSPLAITGISANPGRDTASITWNTNGDANSTVEYGETPALGSTQDSPDYVSAHNILLTGLNSDTLYYYSVTSCTESSECVTEGPFTFTTRGIGSWHDPSWLYRKEIVIHHTHVSEDSPGFPVVIDITDSDLALKAQSDGDDILFTDFNGSKLAHEVESYDPLTNALVAWVSVPLLSSSEDTLLYMYYGNSGAPNQENTQAVWDDNYVMVQHLDEDGGTHYDSTSYANNGTAYNLVSQDVAGKINGADDFDGSDDYVGVLNAGSLQFGVGSFTAEAWIHPRSVPDSTGGARIVNNRGTGLAGDYAGWHLKINNASDRWIVGSSAIDDATGNYMRYDGTTTYDYNQWYQVVMVYEAGSELRFYVNGVLDGTLAIGPYGSISNSLPTAIGASIADQGVVGADNKQFFDGTIDEVRLSNTVRSAGWISTEFSNQGDPSSFYLIENEETASCTTHDDCGFCNKCEGGSCVLQANGEDVKGECPGQDCTTDFCDGAGACGYDIPGTPCTDDGNACTDDECDGAGLCLHPNNINPCDDGIACTETDVCSGGSCNGTPNDGLCSDANDCTDDICTTGVGCSNPDNTDPCDDGIACTEIDVCSGGSCNGTPNDGLCSDANDCTDDICTGGVGCSNPDNTDPCDDGIACTEIDVCSGGSCNGTPNDGLCSDANDCTDDICTGGVGCSNPDNANPCSDGSFCTTADTCAGGSCVGGPPPDCNDSNVCTDDTCNPASGCVYANNADPCNDTLFCNGTDTCNGGTCSDHSGTPCGDDGQFCNGTESCDEAGDQCLNSGDPCLGATECNNSCQEATDTCFNPATTICTDDSNICTDDQCDGAGICTHPYNTSPCDDSISCTEGDVCSVGLCNGTPNNSLCSDANICTDDICTAGVGCSNPDNTDSCDDGIACTESDLCAGGACNGIPNNGLCDNSQWCDGAEICDTLLGCQDASDPDCNDSVACTDDTCNEGTDSCNNLPNNGLCSDGNDCTDDICTTGIGCEYTNNTDPCDDTLFCNGDDTCNAGACSEHSGNPCTLPDVCDEGINQCVATGPGNWWDSSWLYRIPFTIDPANVGTDLTDFPVLIDLADADLASYAQTSGNDLAFTDYNGLQLSHEIELYDNGPGHIIAWVRVPDVSSTEDTILYLYFGNSGATNQEDVAGTWNSNYVMVQHLDETSGDHEDSTGYLNNSDLVVGTDQDAAGSIDGADEFDGAGNYVRVPDNTDGSLQFGEGSFTAEAWIYPHSVTDTGGARIVNNRGTGGGGLYAGWQLKIKDLSDNWYFGDASIDDAAGNYMAYDGTNTYGYNQWHQVVMVYEADSELRFYVNGAPDGTLPVGAYGDITNSLPTAIGASLADQGVEGADDRQFFDGIIDEVRLSDTARSTEWISASYSNQNDPGGFYSVGDLELSEGAPAISAPEPADGAIDVSATLTLLRFTINDPDGDLMDFTVTTNPDIGSATVMGVTNGTYNMPVSGLDYETIYQWDISVDDGSGITDKSYTFTTEMIPGVWWNSTWTYRRTILLDHTDVAEDLNNFPVLIAIDDGSLVSHVQDDADDIAFTDYEGEQLNHEVESYDPLTGALVAWVSVPFLSSTEDTALYMYYGNSEATNQENGPAVWDSSYVMVQHLDETNETHFDSTSNHNDGTAYNLASQDAPGKIDGADEFDAPEEGTLIDVGTDTSLDVFGPGHDFSIFLWVKRDTTTETEGFFSSGSHVSPSESMGIYFGSAYNNTDDLKFMSVGQTVEIESTTEAIGDTGWHHVGVTADRDGNLTFWVDGVAVHAESIAGTSTENWNRQDDTYKIGTDRSELSPMDGIIDEVRVSDMVRNAGWIQTSYTNQNDPGAFYLLGVVESGDSDDDGIPDHLDNCPQHNNPGQEDTYPPDGNGIGDACDCEADFDCSTGVDAEDVVSFLFDFGRSPFNNPCTNERFCYGDFDCNGAVDADDVTKFLEDFGRSQYNNPCPAVIGVCEMENWCSY